MKNKKLPKGRMWNVKRTVVETFQVFATTKEEALMAEKEPTSVTIIKETATLC